LVRYLLLLVELGFRINPVITQKYSLKEEIPEIRSTTPLLTIIIKVTKVLLITEDPKDALNRELG
jgi:hypothetical protein